MSHLYSNKKSLFFFSLLLFFFFCWWTHSCTAESHTPSVQHVFGVEAFHWVLKTRKDTNLLYLWDKNTRWGNKKQRVWDNITIMNMSYFKKLSKEKKQKCQPACSHSQKLQPAFTAIRNLAIKKSRAIMGKFVEFSALGDQTLAVVEKWNQWSGHKIHKAKLEIWLVLHNQNFWVFSHVSHLQSVENQSQWSHQCHNRQLDFLELGAPVLFCKSVNTVLHVKFTVCGKNE